jgi:hypothetical protein
VKEGCSLTVFRAYFCSVCDFRLQKKCSKLACFLPSRYVDCSRWAGFCHAFIAVFVYFYLFVFVCTSVCLTGVWHDVCCSRPSSRVVLNLSSILWIMIMKFVVIVNLNARGYRQKSVCFFYLFIFFVLFWVVFHGNHVEILLFVSSPVRCAPLCTSTPHLFSMCVCVCLLCVVRS